MRICIFEDHGVSLLEPLTLMRPAFDLRCGAGTLLERQVRALGATEIGMLLRPELSELARLQHEGAHVNEPGWLHGGPTVLVNSRWLAPVEPVNLQDARRPYIGMIGKEVAYVVLLDDVPATLGPESIDEAIEGWKDTLTQEEAGGVMIAYPWDLVEHNAGAIREDASWFRQAHPRIRRPEGVAVVGDEDQLVIAEDASLDPFVLIDTRNGPVLIDRGAAINSFSRLEGPCCIGPGSQVLGAKVRGGTLGPHCRVGGEFEASILQGYTNKYHDGFLGHSYLGAWVNMAAGTQVSDLRNDYGQIHVILGGERVPTGLDKVGVFIGDHTKTGLNSLLNCGTVVGAFCNLLPTDSLQPQVVPSFCRVVHGQLQEWSDLRQIFATAGTVMRRRGRDLTDAHGDCIFWLYQHTAAYREQVMRESEQRRLRRSV